MNKDPSEVQRLCGVGSQGNRCEGKIPQVPFLSFDIHYDLRNHVPHAARKGMS